MHENALAIEDLASSGLAGPAGLDPGSGDEGDPKESAWVAVATTMATFGQFLLCLDREFRVVRASPALDALLGPGTAARLAGASIDELVVGGLLAPGGALRAALAAGERREGWREVLRGVDGSQHLVAVSVAPIAPPSRIACAPGGVYAVILRPLEDAIGATLGVPATVGDLVARSPAMQSISHWIENALEYAAAVSRGQPVLPERPPALVGRDRPATSAVGPTAAAAGGKELRSDGVAAARRRAEAEELRRALDEHRWRRQDAARALGISRTTLWRKMREFGLAG